MEAPTSPGDGRGGAIGTGGNEAHLSVTVERTETRPQAQEMGTCMLFTVIDLAEGSCI